MRFADYLSSKELNESLESDVEFTMSDDTVMPKEIHAYFDIDDVRYFCGLILTKYPKVYKIEFGRSVNKKKRHWSFKTAQHARPCLATLLKFLEACEPFVKTKMDGIIIELPNSAQSELYERFMTRIIKRSKTKRYLPVPVVRSSDKAWPTLFLIKRGVRPQALFSSNKFTKNYDFKDHIETDAIEEIKQPYKFIPNRVSETPSVKWRFDRFSFELTIDDALDEIIDEKKVAYFAELDVNPKEVDLKPKKNSQYVARLKYSGDFEIMGEKWKTGEDYYDRIIYTGDLLNLLEWKGITLSSSYTGDIKPKVEKLFGFDLSSKIQEFYQLSDHITFDLDKRYDKSKLPADYFSFLEELFQFIKGMNNDTDRNKSFFSNRTENPFSTGRGNKISVTGGNGIELERTPYNELKGTKLGILAGVISDNFIIYNDGLRQQYMDDKLEPLNLNNAYNQPGFNDLLKEVYPDLIIPVEDLKAVMAHIVNSDGVYDIEISGKYRKFDYDVVYYIQNKYKFSPDTVEFSHALPLDVPIAAETEPFKSENEHAWWDNFNTNVSTSDKQKAIDGQPAIKTWINTPKSPERVKLEESAIRYTGSGYRAINRDLRKLNGNDIPSQLNDDMMNMLKYFREYAPTLDEGIWVYRTTQLPTGDQYLIGEELIDMGFLSTTIDSKMNFSGNGIKLKIFLPKGFRVYPAFDERSSHPNEHEIVLPAGTVIKLVEMHRYKNSDYIYYVGIATGSLNDSILDKAEKYVNITKNAAQMAFGIAAEERVMSEENKREKEETKWSHTPSKKEVEKTKKAIERGDLKKAQK